jgi:hypothetical protein
MLKWEERVEEPGYYYGMSNNLEFDIDNVFGPIEISQILQTGTFVVNLFSSWYDANCGKWIWSKIDG